MVSEERLERGKLVFVFGIMLTAIVQAGYGIVTLGMHFTWIGFLLSAVPLIGLMWLASQVYAGQARAQVWLLGLVAFKVAAGLILLTLALSPGEAAQTARRLGAPAAWPVFIELGAYLFLAWGLLAYAPGRAYLAQQRGVEPAAAEVTAEAPSLPIEVPETATENAYQLARGLGMASAALIILGVLQAALAITVATLEKREGKLGLITAVLTLILGLILKLPAREVHAFSSKANQNTGQLLRFVQVLRRTFAVQVIVLILLVVVYVLQI